MFLRRLALPGLIVLCVVPVHASIVVREIDIRGLKSTNRWVVERELQFQAGDTITTSELEAAHNRLHNLTVFNDAELTDSSGIVVVDVTEAWPILPEMGVKLTRGDFWSALKNPRRYWESVEVMLGVRHLNFRGNASELFAFIQVGASNGFFVGYETRWWSPRVPLSVHERVQYLEVTDRHAAVLDSSRKMRDDAISVAVGTHEGARERIGLGAAYQRVKQAHDWPAEGRNFRTAWFSPFAVLDHRDLEWWPSRGGLAEVRGDIAVGTEAFVRSQYAIRAFIPVASWYAATTRARPSVLALIAGTGTSTSRTPSFAHYYAGFEDGYRGYRFERSESAGYITGQAEWRFPISPEGTYNVPLIGRWGRRWPIGVAGVVFVQRTELQFYGQRRELLGYGGGLYVRVPYNQIVEFAYARNKEGHEEITFQAGVSF